MRSSVPRFSRRRSSSSSRIRSRSCRRLIRIRTTKTPSRRRLRPPSVPSDPEAQPTRAAHAVGPRDSSASSSASSSEEQQLPAAGGGGDDSCLVPNDILRSHRPTATECNWIPVVPLSALAHSSCASSAPPPPPSVGTD